MDKLLTEILTVLKLSSNSLSVQEIAKKINEKGFLVKETDILRCLNQAYKDGQVELDVMPLSDDNNTSTRYKAKQ